MNPPSLPDLPINEALPALAEALTSRRSVLLEAPPGAGKSTIVPLFLRPSPWLGDRKILMLEPRRIAARAVAGRMAQLLGEAVGRSVGFRTRLETRVSRETRIEVVTEGILTRMLQDDSGLSGIGCVIFDEFHERSLNADLGLALCIESQQNLREDLRLLVMSATLDVQPIARLLDDAPIVAARGRSFEVATHFVARRPEDQPRATNGAGDPQRPARSRRRHPVFPARCRGDSPRAARARGVRASIPGCAYCRCTAIWRARRRMRPWPRRPPDSARSCSPPALPKPA